MRIKERQLLLVKPPNKKQYEKYENKKTIQSKSKGRAREDSNGGNGVRCLEPPQVIGRQGCLTRPDLGHGMVARSPVSR